MKTIWLCYAILNGKVMHALLSSMWRMKKKIGYYVSNIRQKYKQGHLSVEEQAQYESLNGWRWVASDLQSSTIRDAGRAAVADSLSAVQ